MRADATERYFAVASPRIAQLCHRMAERFARGGRLIAFGTSPAARTDVCHVAVEFVHPVIVGKRALPAIGLTGETCPVVDELALHVAADDVVMAFGELDDAPELSAGITIGDERGALTVAFSPLGAEWEFPVDDPDPGVRQELVEVLYHVVWELVHVFFEHRGLLEGRDARPVSDAGASSFLYPFLAEQETDLQAVLDDVSRSALAKARETQALRESTVAGAPLAAVAAALAGAERILTFGNGGSATDAADAAVDFAARGRPALDLCQTSAILTAIANDIGPEAMLVRQLIAHGKPGDVLLVFSTSGQSESVLDGLAEARRRAIPTIALVGYDGGTIARDGLADHVVVTPSQHIPRIQEAQATISHLLCGCLGP
jgi:D-sedoheptulose 7-phosphate isomerase